MIYYTIVPVEELTNVMLNASTTKSLSSARISSDGNSCILKFEEEKAAQYFIERKWYSQKEIEEIISQAPWV